MKKSFSQTMLCIGLGSLLLQSALVAVEQKPKSKMNADRPVLPNIHANVAQKNYQENVPAVKNTKRVLNKTVNQDPSTEGCFLRLLDKSRCWTPVFDDHFCGHKLNNKIWNTTIDDSTGGGNNALESYNNNATDNIVIKDSKLHITAKAEWYVQPIGCKNVCRTPSEYDPTRAARPYTSGAINTFGKVPIHFEKAGYIEIKFKGTGGAGSQPTFWMYPMNDTYGNWSASGELDILEIWHGPVGQLSSIGSGYNYPQGAIWFGGAFPDNALLFSNPTVPSDPTGTDWHTVQFAWDGHGLFIWKLDGIVNFIVGPSNYQVRFESDPNSPLIVNPYGSYISIVGNSAIANQPYQGSYVGYYDSTTDSVITTNPSPSPFDATNPFFLMVELQVGGNVFANIAPDNGDVFDAGNTVDLSTVPDGLLSNYDAQQLGLPQRPQAYFTDNQTMKVDYVKYMILK